MRKFVNGWHATIQLQYDWDYLSWISFRFISRMYDILCDLFAERMPQDKSYKYKPDTVNVYFENRINATLHQVDVQKTIQEITADKKYVWNVNALQS